ncbi:gustatory receptor for sugar taste 64a-like [Bradysia coprophila]|uniref:gustatory receptor for sugar taste 64a-like n=1 Tax=Bradysia coprophila TaxID=38358 RepID=UPI00187DB446|nr:gustatory receptor for sugar taste 64a-like [Bradysia coprophila]
MSIDYILWSELRQHYVLLCELLEIIDNKLASLILLSCANNLYFICYQLVNIFEELPDLLNYIYFWYSLILLIGRTIVMFLCISEINDASKKPLDMVRQIRSRMWCTELERFSDQLTNETIALSGMNFFFITRKLVLSMIGTIITYELVLLQFDSQLDPDADKKELKEFCNLK